MLTEPDVLEHVALWAIREGWKLDSVSYPRGQNRRLGASRDGDDVRKLRFIDHLAGLGVTDVASRFTPNGPDLVLRRGSETWRIECKGWSGGSRPTLESNFARALASVVLNFDETPSLRSGLALPDGYFFNLRSGSRLSEGVRRALNLWVLMVMEDGDVAEIGPDQVLPPD
jgi:hypothetical protein